MYREMEGRRRSIDKVYGCVRVVAEAIKMETEQCSIRG